MRPKRRWSSRPPRPNSEGHRQLADRLQPVFDAIAASAKRLIGGLSAAVFRFVDGSAHLAALTPTSPAADEVLKASFPRPLADFPPFERLRNGEAVQIADAETAPDVAGKGHSTGARLSQRAVRAPDERWRPFGRGQRHPSGTWFIRRLSCPIGSDLCRSGGHRHREHPSV